MRPAGAAIPADVVRPSAAYEVAPISNEDQTPAEDGSIRTLERQAEDPTVLRAPESWRATGDGHSD